MKTEFVHLTPTRDTMPAESRTPLGVDIRRTRVTGTSNARTIASEHRRLLLAPTGLWCLAWQSE